MSGFKYARYPKYKRLNEKKEKTNRNDNAGNFQAHHLIGYLWRSTGGFVGHFFLQTYKPLRC